MYHLCITCVSLVYHLCIRQCITCVSGCASAIYQLCISCVSPVYHLCITRVSGSVSPVYQAVYHLCITGSHNTEEDARYCVLIRIILIYNIILYYFDYAKGKVWTGIMYYTYYIIFRII